MPYTIDTVQEKAYITVNYTGKVRLSDLVSAFPPVIKLFSESQQYRLLLDLSTSITALTIEDYYECLNAFSRDFPGHMKIALYWPDGRSRIIRFLMNIASNRGIQLRIFDHQAAAIEWLEP